MLEPQDRRLLLKSFSPPLGHRLDWAVGTTYSLDLIALLAAPVAFAFSDAQDREGRPVMEPLALLKATRQYANQLLLFCQAGKIHVPKNYQPLLAHLENSIAQSIAPGGGSFHPKVWFLRYIAADNSVTYRMLCLSRNMTFDRSWDTILSIEGPLRDRTHAIARNHPLGQFVEGLPTTLQRPLSTSWDNRLKTLAHEIRRVEFACPEPFEEMIFWPLGLTGDKAWPFPKRLDQMLVISPFVDDGFLNRLAQYDAPQYLVSRPESLMRLSSNVHSQFEELWTLDEAAEPETTDHDIDEMAPTNASERADESTTEAPRTSPLLGLHAKLYIADAGWNSHVWTGSANATTTAFTKNVEFLVELRGKKSRCGVAAILGQSRDSEHPHVASLRDMLKPFLPNQGEYSTDIEEEDFKRLADSVAKTIVACVPVATCQSFVEGEVYSLTIRPTKAPVASLPSGHILRVRPISMPFAPMQTVNDFSATSWCSFEQVSELGLTSFFVWEICSSDERFTHAFVLNVPLENPPRNRAECILRHLLTDRARVFRYLMLLLMDPNSRSFGMFAQSLADPDDSQSQAIPGLSESTLLESLLRNLDRYPEQIDHVEQVIRDLTQSPQGREMLPDGLEAIWGPIWSVRQQKHANDTMAQ